MASKASRRGPTPGEAGQDLPAPGPGEQRPSVIEEVRQLVQLMVENDLGEVDITDGHRKILLKRSSAYVPAVQMMPAQMMPAGQPMAPAAHAPAAAPTAAAEEPPGEKLLEVRSPMVGTYYSAASPDSEAFVSVGSVVEEDSPVCIVEAMKVMNEVQAECAGTITEICVKNAQPVEYGQVLFRVRPN